MSSSVKKGVLIVLIANIVNMLFSVLSNFLLPKYLSIESYGYYKVYMLYIGYLGLAHFGFADGVYLRYGGKEFSSIDSNRLLQESATLRNSQFLFTFIMLLGAVYLHNPLIILLALSCVPINMISFYKSLFQATGRFKDYGLVLSLLPILIFICDIILLFVFHSDDYLIYISVVLLSNIFLYWFLEQKFTKLLGEIKLLTFNMRLFKENAKTGFALMVGNFASLLITSFDRWLIQAWMSITAFSFYSFAVSVENLYNVCVSAVTTTLYNHLCKEKDDAKIVKIKSICIIIGIYLIAVAFPVKAIINYWLQKYSASINCLFLLICAHLFYFVIKAIYINLYKARGLQRHYLYQMIGILSVAVLSAIIAYWGISKSIEVFAWSSLFTAIVWFFVCFFEFKKIRGNWREVLLMFTCSGIYLTCGLCIENAVKGLVYYLLIATILIVLLNRTAFITLVNMFIEPLIRYVHKK